MCKDLFYCQAGCKSYHGGEVRHHKDCVHYPESFTKMYDEAIARIRSIESVIKSALEIKALWLPPMDNYSEEQQGEYDALYAMESVFKQLLTGKHKND